MNQKTLLSGTAAIVVGLVGSLVMAATPFVPTPWNVLAGLVGFLACALAGLSVKPPEVMAGRPILQGTALTAATGIGALLQQMVLPALATSPEWAQSIAYVVLGVLAWLTGRALPALGSTVPVPTSPPTPLETKAEAIAELRKGPPEG